MPAKTPRVKTRKNAPMPKAAPLRPPAPISAQPPPMSKVRLKRALPAKSVQNAAKAFKNFSLSRFPKGATTSNFVPHPQAKVPAAVSAVQRHAMTQQVSSLAARAPAGPGISLALPLSATAVTALLPSFNAGLGTVDLIELLGLLRQRMQGTDFYASGNPTLNRIVQDSALLSQVQAYINAIKTGGA